MSTTLTKPDARCEECGERFVCPAVARCPECDSKQVRRLDPRNEAIGEALAELDCIESEMDSIRRRLTNARNLLWHLVTQ